MSERGRASEQVEPLTEIPDGWPHPVEPVPQTAEEENLAKRAHDAAERAMRDRETMLKSEAAALALAEKAREEREAAQHPPVPPPPPAPTPAARPTPPRT